MISRLPIVSAMILACALCTVIEVRAEFSILELDTGFGTAGGTNPMFGWEFKPNVDISVTKLGLYDAASNGLASSHTLGLFDAPTGSLLTSTTIGAGTVAPLEGPTTVFTPLPSHVPSGGGFRYVDITPTLLEAGHNYVVAGTAAGYVDSTAIYQAASSLLLTASEITFVQGRYTFFGPQVFGFPADTFPNADFGPVFQFTPVPEPSSVLLILLGGLAGPMAVYGRRWRRLRMTA